MVISTSAEKPNDVKTVFQKSHHTTPDGNDAVGNEGRVIVHTMADVVAVQTAEQVPESLAEATSPTSLWVIRSAEPGSKGQTPFATPNTFASESEPVPWHRTSKLLLTLAPLFAPKADPRQSHEYVTLRKPPDVQHPGVKLEFKIGGPSAQRSVARTIGIPAQPPKAGEHPRARRGGTHTLLICSNNKESSKPTTAAGQSPNTVATSPIVIVTLHSRNPFLHGIATQATQLKPHRLSCRPTKTETKDDPK